MRFVNTFLPVFEIFFYTDPGVSFARAKSHPLLGGDLDHSVAHNKRQNALDSCEFVNRYAFAIIGRHYHAVGAICVLEMVDDFVCVFQCLDIFDVQLVNGENLLFDFHSNYLFRFSLLYHRFSILSSIIFRPALGWGLLLESFVPKLFYEFVELFDAFAIECDPIDFATEFAISIEENGILGFGENFEIGFDELSVCHSVYLSFFVSVLYHEVTRLSIPF